MIDGRRFDYRSFANVYYVLQLAFAGLLRGNHFFIPSNIPSNPSNNERNSTIRSVMNGLETHVRGMANDVRDYYEVGAAYIRWLFVDTLRDILLQAGLGDISHREYYYLIWLIVQGNLDLL